MRLTMVILAAAMLAVSLGLAQADMTDGMKDGMKDGKADAMKGNVSGTVTGINGDMWTIETADGKMKKVHVDPSSTKKHGDVKVGAMVSADVTAGGHANWIRSDDKKGGSKKKEAMEDMHHE
jgi:hypothetical protein